MQELIHAVIQSNVMVCKTEHGLCIILSTKDTTVVKQPPLQRCLQLTGEEGDSDGVKQQRNKYEIFLKGKTSV